MFSQLTGIGDARVKSGTLIFLFVGVGAIGLLIFALGGFLAKISPQAPVLETGESHKVLSWDSERLIHFEFFQGIEWETKTPVLFLHGFNGQMSAWDRVWGKMDGCGPKIRLDIPGYGRSKWPTESYDLSFQAARILDFLDRLGIQKVNLVGASMGGALSVWFAAQYPHRVGQLVLLAPSGYPGALSYGGWFGIVLKYSILKKVAKILARTRMYRFLAPKSVALQALTVTDSYRDLWIEALKKVTAPTWLLWSPGDTGVLYAYASKVVQELSQGILLSLPDSVGHDIPTNASGVVARLVCGIQKEVNSAQLHRQMQELIQENRGKIE